MHPTDALGVATRSSHLVSMLISHNYANFCKSEVEVKRYQCMNVVLTLQDISPLGPELFLFSIISVFRYFVFK